MMTADLRSDTFTKPTPAMLETMFNAPVGDDVFGEDPSVNELESLAAGMFGMEAALFCPTGTMTNQIGIKCHTQPGDEVICEKNSHVYQYEGGGIASNSGCQVRPLEGPRGLLTAEMISEVINPDDLHKARTSLVSLENTSNRGGGACYDFTEFQKIKEVCSKNSLKFHLDGARIWNALVARNEDPKAYGETFDSISICLSKGLGTPIGSLLLGTHTFIKKARRVRKSMGGGMRQAGYMAAAGIYALEHHIGRLAIDHDHAHQLAQALLEKSFVGKMMPVETNILIFEVKGGYTAPAFCDELKRYGILCLPVSASQVRMVTHLDFTKEMLKQVLETIESL